MKKTIFFEACVLVVSAAVFVSCTPAGQTNKMPGYKPTAPPTAGTIDQLVGTRWTQENAPFPPRIHFEDENTMDLSGSKCEYDLSSDGILTVKLGDKKTIQGTWSGEVLVLNGMPCQRIEGEGLL